LETVPALLTAAIVKMVWGNTERTIERLDEQTHDMAQVLDSMDMALTWIEDAICHAEKMCGPLDNLMLDEKAEKFLHQIFDRLDESVAHLQGDMRTIAQDYLAMMECFL
jgi:hypothetical protein